VRAQISGVSDRIATPAVLTLWGTWPASTVVVHAGALLELAVSVVTGEDWIEGIALLAGGGLGDGGRVRGRVG